MTTPKRYETILECCNRTGISERALRGWLARGLSSIIEDAPGKVGRPRILVDVQEVDSWRVLYARPTSFQQMLKASFNRQKGEATKKKIETIENIQDELSRNLSVMLRNEALTGLRDVAIGIRTGDKELQAQLLRDHAADLVTLIEWFNALPSDDIPR